MNWLLKKIIEHKIAQERPDLLNAPGNAWKFNFQHRIKRNDNRQLRPYYDLGPKSVINGVTTCVITAPDGTIGIGTAICGAGDKFSREEGRSEAANAAVNSLPPELRFDARLAYNDFEDSEE